MVTTVTRAVREGEDKAISTTSGKFEVTETANGNDTILSRSLSSESTDTIVVIIEEGPTEVGKVTVTTLRASFRPIDLL